MAAAQNPPASGGDSKKWTTVLVPVAGVASIVILVIVIASTSDSPSPTSKNGTDDGNVVTGSGQPMPSDGSDGGTEDPGLKAIGSGGLKYRDLKLGDGPECPADATVTAHYAGWLVNGKEFDGSKKHSPPDPIDFPLNGVVKGWTDGIPGMKVGGVRKLVIPAALGYGAGGRPPKIPGGATLIFEVQLIAIK